MVNKISVIAEYPIFVRKKVSGGELGEQQIFIMNSKKKKKNMFALFNW